MSKFYPKLIGHLQTRIRKQLADSTITINELLVDTGIFSFVSGGGIKYHVDNEYGRKVGLLPIKISESLIYWLSINLSHNTSTKTIKGISIAVYSDNNFIKLFRAEWANNELKYDHAQPHWHIHPKKTYNDKKEWHEEEESIFFEDAEETIKEKIENLHFAMSAPWHKKESHIVTLSKSQDAEILNWIEGVLNYIFKELKYIHDKSMS